jgi:hypothetical protein
MNEYYLDIFLTQTYKGLGQYEIIENANIIGELKEFTLYDLTEPPSGNRVIKLPSGEEFIIITGITESKLNQVKRYDLTEPYKVGVKGVTDIKSTYVEYKIDDFTYKTYVNNIMGTPPPTPPPTPTPVPGTDITGITSARAAVTNQTITTTTNQSTNTGITEYRVVKLKESFENQPVIWNENSSFIDVKKTLNAMVIERGNISVYDYFNKINNCENLNDLLEIF